MLGEDKGSDEIFFIQVDAIRHSGLLGQRGRLLTLFNYLVENWQKHPPNEQVIAREVFDKQGQNLSIDDASVRVYMHRLRKKLEEFYLRHDDRSGVRLMIPKGQYCLKLDSQSAYERQDEIQNLLKVYTRSDGRLRLMIIIVLLTLLNIAILSVNWSTREQSELAQQHIIWDVFSGRDKPVRILIGDYYLVGEFVDTPVGPYLQKLVRDFRVNSSTDLAFWSKRRGDEFAHTKDVGLTYVPLSVAFALNEILPQLEKRGRHVELFNVTEANASVLNNADIIYVGLISGMQFVETVVFEDATFKPGIDYDEIVDTRNALSFRTEEPFGRPEGHTYTDYGYVSLQKSENNIRLAITGLRDAGLRGVAKTLGTNSLTELPEFSVGQLHNEVLFSVQGLQQANIEPAVPVM